MPYCKNCHHEISKFDTDLCPYCGQENPIDDNYATMDMTQHIDPQAKGYHLYRSKAKNVYVLLCCLLGYFGVHDFYLGYAKKGLFEVGLSLFVIGGSGSVIFFTGLLSNAFAFVIPFLVVWLFYIILGITYSRKDSLKDSKGEFLR